MKKYTSVILGMKAENYFASILNKLGIEHYFKDTWYDFLINKKIKIEVKSCQLSIKEKKDKYRIGRFDFTKLENRKLQYKENIWCCFILRNKEDFLLLGFIKAKILKKRRYISLIELRKLKIIDLKTWLSIINK